MIPGTLNLPTIWRGCDWPEVTLKWKDQNGNPFNLTGWTPFVTFLNGQTLNPAVTDAPNGVTTISMGKDQTSNLKIGNVSWDWVWQRDSPIFRYPPSLSGSIPIREAETNGGS